MNIIKYVGIPYEEANCLEVIQMYYKDQFSIELKNYYEGPMPDRKTVESLIISNAGTFVPVEEATPMILGDLIVINLYGYSCHLGMYIEDGKMLHSIRKVGSCVEPVRKYLKMIEGCYRHQRRAA